MIRSIASANSELPISFLARRAASIADSFTRFARSAPLKPTVCLATRSMSTSSSNGLPLECTSRICTLPFRSGLSRHHTTVEPAGPQQTRDRGCPDGSWPLSLSRWCQCRNRPSQPVSGSASAHARRGLHQDPLHDDDQQRLSRPRTRYTVSFA